MFSLEEIPFLSWCLPRQKAQCSVAPLSRVPEKPHSPRVWITGLGSQYPPHSRKAEHFDQMARNFYDMENPGLQKLLQISHNTGIEYRSFVSQYASSTDFATQPTPPTITEIDAEFRHVGVDLAVSACHKALAEWGGDLDTITHTIGVTCTTTGNPGYDLLVNQKLGLATNVNRMLLHGVGCAGGLAIMRAAAQIADGATARGRPARILAYACEVVSSSYRFELEEACRSHPADVNIAPALFSDGAAAFVLCNDYGREEGDRALFEVMEWGNDTIPGTVQDMNFYIHPNGYKSYLSKDIPSLTSTAIAPMFYHLLPSLRRKENDQSLDIHDFDWALHPGGGAILKAASKLLNLAKGQLRESWEIYRNHGNSSSATVLIVLDRMRSGEQGRDHVVATAFGPGLSIEMAMLRRCHEEEELVLKDKFLDV